MTVLFEMITIAVERFASSLCAVADRRGVSYRPNVSVSNSVTIKVCFKRGLAEVALVTPGLVTNIGYKTDTGCRENRR
jgi:hypothetical protein